MKTKFLSILVTIAMLCGNPCYASPSITRDYIVRKSGKQTHREERLFVNYSNLQMEQGDFLIISFLDNQYNILEERILDLNVDSLVEDEIFIDSDLLYGTAYIEIELIGPESGYDGIKLPLNINNNI